MPIPIRSYAHRDILNALAEGGKTPADVLFVYHREHGLGSWDDFELAVRTYEVLKNRPWYAPGDGENGLLVVGRGWWVERWVHDGRADDGWNYRTSPEDLASDDHPISFLAPRPPLTAVLGRLSP